MPNANRFGARYWSRTIANSDSIKTQPSPRQSVRRSLLRLPTSWRTSGHRSSASTLDFPRPLYSRVSGGWGAKILSSATTVDEALWLEARGIDAIIAQGLEAGGHRGHFLSDDLTRQLTTFTLIPQIAQAVNVPVIAAGGIADARGVAAARSLGAAGVQPGTAYLLWSGSNDKFGAPRGVNKRCRASHCPNESVWWPSSARHYESLDARSRSAELCRAGVSTCHRRARAASRKSRTARSWRLLSALGRSKRQRLPRNQRT
jgi:hypothetical protein